jgi:lysophospholipid acyltransferase
MLDELFIKGSKLLNGNIPPDHLKLAFSIFATYPSAILFKHIRSTQTRHLFSTAYSVFIMAGILRLYDGLLHITATAVFTFLFMKYFKGKNGPWINFIFVMVSMSLW